MYEFHATTIKNLKSTINRLTGTVLFIIRAQTGNIEKLSESHKIWYTGVFLSR